MDQRWHMEGHPEAACRQAHWRCRHRLAPRIVAVALVSCFGRAAAQSQYFEVLKYRDPTQCERMQCQSVRSEYCREHQPGFSLREKGCPEGQICTNCVYGNTSYPTQCRCENPPFSQPVLYGQECNMGQVCTEGQGICYRPCDTFLHITFCEDSLHCRWNTTTYTCESKPEPADLVEWSLLPSGTPYGQGMEIVSMMSPSLLPQGFDDFSASAKGYMIQGMLLSDLIQMESMFLQLDQNNNGLLDAAEYARLPSTLAALEAAAIAQQGSTPTSGARRLSSEDMVSAIREFEGQDERNLAAHEASETSTTTTTASAAFTAEATTTTTVFIPTPEPAVVVRPEACGAMWPVKFYCSFDQSCKSDCKECGWKSATDSAFSMCVRPSANTCHADGSQEFCPTDQACHPNGDCSECVDRPIVDHASHLCLAIWWKREPSDQWTNWVCRDRNKVGMPCRNDQDCIYGLRRCLGGKCQPLQPYNQNLTCADDVDCPHIGHYCPEDPTGGENIYWVQYCRRQKEKDETCKEDRQCVPDTLCNVAEPQARCRRYFSLGVGTPSKDDTLCSTGWRDRHGKCAPPAKSKEAGRSCDSDRDCKSTDASGRTGECKCKAWWDRDDSKYCEPVTGDYEDHWTTRRDFIYFKSKNCGSFWTEEECLRVFGNEALKLKLDMQCETQELSGGPHLPPHDCGVVDQSRFPDYCAAAKTIGG